MIEVKIDEQGVFLDAKGVGKVIAQQSLLLVLIGARIWKSMLPHFGVEIYKQAVEDAIKAGLLEEYANDENSTTEVSEIDLAELLRQMQQGGDTDG